MQKNTSHDSRDSTVCLTPPLENSGQENERMLLNSLQCSFQDIKNLDNHEALQLIMNYLVINELKDTLNKDHEIS